MFCSKCGAKIEAGAKFCSSCGHAVTTGGGAVVPIKTTGDNQAEHTLAPTSIIGLKKYLSDVLEREQVLFTLNQMKDELEERIWQVSNDKAIFPSAPTKDEPDYLGAMGTIWGIGGFFAAGGLIFGGILTMAGAPNEVTTPCWVVMVGAILISIIVTVASNRTAINEANRSNETRQEVYDNELEIAQKEAAAIKAKKTSLIPILNEKQAEIEKAINETRTTLDVLYSLGVIGEKYRHFIPVASFCEYIQYERCDNMGSAYNIYESELRQDMIIGQLGAVIQGLESIREGQYMLYQAISDANRISHSIMGELQGLKGKVDKVAATSTMNTYFAKQTAHNSRLLVDINRGAYGFLYDKAGQVVF